METPTFDEVQKSIVESKTLWVSVLAPALVTLTSFLGVPVAPWIAANPEATAWIAGGIMAVLRLVSHKKVSVSKKPTAESTPAE